MHIVLKYYQNFTGFGDSNVSACDPKVGRDPPVLLTMGSWRLFFENIFG